MDRTWLSNCDVGITVEDHPTQYGKFLVHINKDSYGTMDKTPVGDLPQDLVVPLMKAASQSGYVEQETSSRANFFFVNENTVVTRDTKMDRLDFLYWIVQQFGPTDIAYWAKERRALLPILRPVSVRKQRLRAGQCPECGSAGKMVRMALVCPTHGWYAGC